MRHLVLIRHLLHDLPRQIGTHDRKDNQTKVLIWGAW
jgi:hypothetical protein